MARCSVAHACVRLTVALLAGSVHLVFLALFVLYHRSHAATGEGMDFLREWRNSDRTILVYSLLSADPSSYAYAVLAYTFWLGACFVLHAVYGRLSALVHAAFR